MESSNHTTKEAVVGRLKDAIWEETVRRELRHHKLCEQFTMTPGMRRGLVVSNKITGEKHIKVETTDASEYMAILKHQTMSPKEKYPLPLTSSQEYGWETAPLMRLRDPRLHHVHVQSDVTRTFEQCGGFKK